MIFLPRSLPRHCKFYLGLPVVNIKLSSILTSFPESNFRKLFETQGQFQVVGARQGEQLLGAKLSSLPLPARLRECCKHQNTAFHCESFIEFTDNRHWQQYRIVKELDKNAKDILFTLTVFVFITHEKRCILLGAC